MVRIVLEVSILSDNEADHIILWVLGNNLIIIVGMVYYLSEVHIPASIEVRSISSSG